ncbi:MAG: sigma-70 family RNA polymerase sigma factor [Reichenbachiella sp.]|uniref:RNA polymerase sigma factor n=1 Tax=Reichenbachiella sp. TaxID=2184521 RepID=UPI00326417FC
MTEANIIKELKNGNTSVLKHVYVHLNTVTSFVTKNSGSREDGHDIFQETVIVFHRNAIKEEFLLTSSIGTYLFAIGRRMWLNQLRRKKIKIADSEIDQDLTAVETFEFELPQFSSPDLGQKIHKILDEVGDTCKEILQLFYFKKLNLEAIKERLAYRSSQVVRQQKYRCLKKIRDKVSKMPTLIQQP